MRYFEVSARTYTNVEVLFDSMNIDMLLSLKYVLHVVYLHREMF